MITKLKKTTRTTLLLAMMAGLSAGVSAVPDVLDAPAMPSALAAKTLLLDVVRAGSRLVAVGERGHVVFSDDDGASWQQGSVPVSTTLTGVYFSTPSHGWAVGHSGVVLATTDSGATWTKQLDGNQINKLVVDRMKAVVAQLEAGAENDEALAAKLEEAQFAMEDAEANSESGPANPLLDVWFADQKHGFVIGAYGMFLHTNDGGASWQDWSANLQNPDRYHLNGIAQVTGGSLFIVGEAGLMATSSDKGLTWSSVQSPYDGSLFGVSGTGNVNEAVIFGLRGNVFRTTDLGRSWITVTPDRESTLVGAAATDKGDVVLVGNGGTVLFSNNAGETFKAVVRPDNVALTAVSVLPDKSLVLVGEGGAVRASANGDGQ